MPPHNYNDRKSRSLKDFKWLPLLLIVPIAFASIYYFRTNSKEDTITIQEVSIQAPEQVPLHKIGQFEYVLEIADTAKERRQGLSGRSSLPAKHGLLFVFEELGDYGIWMKDMLFALDIIWLNSDQQVIGLEANVQPETYPQSFHAPADSLYVLEINAGEAAAADLQLGDQVYLAGFD